MFWDWIKFIILLLLLKLNFFLKRQSVKQWRIPWVLVQSGASRCTYRYSEKNYSHENSLDRVNSLHGSWRQTRGWQTNTFKNCCTRKSIPLFKGYKCMKKQKGRNKEPASNFNEERNAFLSLSRWGEYMALKEWSRRWLFLLDCPSKLTPFIPSFLCRRKNLSLQNT